MGDPLEYPGTHALDLQAARFDAIRLAEAARLTVGSTGLPRVYCFGVSGTAVAGALGICMPGILCMPPPIPGVL